MNAPQPLAGKRILVTRASHQAGSLAELLERKGAEVLCLPTIAIVPSESYAALDRALETIQSFDWLIFTSANAVEAMAGLVHALNLPLDRLTRMAHVAAIGPATAHAAREIGLRVDLVPTEYVAESLIASLETHVPGKRVLLVRAAVGRDVIPEALRRLGAEIHVADAYQTVLPAASIEGLRALFASDRVLPDAVTFTSSSTVKNFFTLLEASGLEAPPDLRAVSIGPITTRTLREHHWGPAAEATHSTLPGLVEACERLLENRSLRG